MNASTLVPVSTLIVYSMQSSSYIYSSNIILIFFFTASDFGILFNQTRYTVVVDHTLALTGIPIVPFTVYFSESVTSTSLFNSWSASLSSIAGAGSHFDVPLFHPFPTNFQPPLADSDAIVVNTDNPPEPGNYRYTLQIHVIIDIISVTFNSVEVNITIFETPG